MGGISVCHTSGNSSRRCFGFLLFLSSAEILHSAPFCGSNFRLPYIRKFLPALFRVPAVFKFRRNPAQRHFLWEGFPSAIHPEIPPGAVLGSCCFSPAGYLGSCSLISACNSYSLFNAPSGVMFASSSDFSSQITGFSSGVVKNESCS